MLGLHAPTKIPKDIKMLKEEAAPPTMAGVAGMSGMGSGSGVPGGVMGGIGTAPAPVVKVAPPKGPTRVSSGVVSGLKISGANPTYPPIARAAHVSGAVVLQALISKEGTIKNLLSSADRRCCELRPPKPCRTGVTSHIC